MLSFEQRVTENVRIRGHGYIFVCRKGLPEFVKEGSIIDTKVRGNTGTEAGPILVNWSVSLSMTWKEETNLGVIAFSPFEEGGVDAKILCVELLAWQVH